MTSLAAAPDRPRATVQQPLPAVFTLAGERNWPKLQVPLQMDRLRFSQPSLYLLLHTAHQAPPFPDGLMLISTGLFSTVQCPVILHNCCDVSDLLRGPRRVVRLCLCSLVLPAVLITIPLYVRLVLYPPGHYPMMPTDQRLLSRHVSSLWCQAQTTHMDGNFNGYLLKGAPSKDSQRRTHVMLNKLVLKDDVKEYWGFYFLKGSTITISLCSRWDGGQLMILRGLENLHRCAWIGEEDSAEDMVEDDDVASNERHKLEEQSMRGGPNVFTTPEELPDVERSSFAQQGHSAPAGDPSPPHHLQSEERRQSISELLRKAIKMSKGKSEILRILHAERKAHNAENQLQDKSQFFETNTENSTAGAVKLVMDLDEVEKVTSNQTDMRRDASAAHDLPQRLKKVSRKLKSETRKDKRRREKKKRKKGNPRDENLTKELFPKDDNLTRSRAKRFIEDKIDNENGAFEELDSDDILSVISEVTSNQGRRNFSSVERAIGGEIFFPEGLKFERGRFNQSTANDNSNEEHRSSYSSSEEALASCEGVILTLPLVPYRSCSYQSIEMNKIVYDIPITGTYYFVFSSDNEIYVNDLYFNMTMERVVYNTKESEELCVNTTDCTMPLKFWSEEQAVVEVPQEGRWDHAYILDTKCEPRVYMYLTMLLLVPLCIMFCALR
ncbi:hypothetical protein Hamer_G006226 [Homarus americanus]|uniref:E3 ubiquitin-protein ligase APD1-4 middle domain-containing protein n=1 Tax=Homarus americanus TaxID=6706 RepID=A0A8J5JTD5_HOMAM|nr:hypothetical protein Hamer_G006226 [Homarus americanus]